MGEEQMVRVFWVWRLEEARERYTYSNGPSEVVDADSLERAAKEFADDVETPQRIRVLDPHTGESAVFDVSVVRSVELVQVREEEEAGDGK